MIKAKKGQAIDGLNSLVTPLVAVAIVLAISFLIFSETKTQVADNIDSSSITNEWIAWTNNTYVEFGVGTSLVEISCDQVANGTGGAVIGSGNYTCDVNGFKLNDNAGYNWNTTVLINYTYKNASLAYNATNEVQNATQSIPGWLPIIIITIIGGILIAMVAMYRRNQ